MNELTDGSQHSYLTDAALASWLLGDAKKLEGTPGYNNMQSAMRQAAFRLDPESAPWLAGGEESERTLEQVSASMKSEVFRGLSAYFAQSDGSASWGDLELSKMMHEEADKLMRDLHPGSDTVVDRSLAETDEETDEETARWEAYARGEGLVYNMPNSSERRAFIAALREVL